MRELFELLAVFAGIYLFDCVHWARREAIGFRAWYGRRMRVVSGAETAGNERFGVIFAQPLPMFGRLFITQAFPLSLTREVASSFVSSATNPGVRAAQVERLVRFDEPHVVTLEARRVLVDDHVFVEAGSNRLARLTASLIAELKVLGPEGRAARIERWTRTMLDVGIVRERIEAFDGAARSVRHLCLAEWLFVFAVTPIVGVSFGLASSWLPLLAGLVVLQTAVTIAFARAHAGLYPDEKRARRSEVFLIALSPPSAMRAVDALSRDLLAEFHPLAAACAFVPRDEFEELCERNLRDLLHPLPMARVAADPAVRAAAAEWQARMLAALETFAQQEGVARALWREPPPRFADDCLAYCPRCTRQFTVQSGTCERCQGLELVSFSGT
ncbi:MAG: hypothetical protein JNL28_02345 [Planctomycetes bacterium]|nr:hypothetical protein [Planctomycetota bacterium]